MYKELPICTDPHKRMNRASSLNVSCDAIPDLPAAGPHDKTLACSASVRTTVHCKP